MVKGVEMKNVGKRLMINLILHIITIKVNSILRDVGLKPSFRRLVVYHRLKPVVNEWKCSFL